VAYRPRQRVLLAARLECRLAAGSSPRNGHEHRSLALWAVREPILAIGDFVFVLLSVLSVLGGRVGGRRVFVCLWVCYHDNSKLLRASILTKLGL